MRKFKGLALLLVVSSVLFISCTKEGPEGPAGAPGTPGTPGAPGAPGAGQTTYSAWFSVDTTDWTFDGNPPYYSFFLYKKTAPALTQAIIDNGVILSYMKNWTFQDTVTGLPAKEPNKIVQLPYMADIFNFDYYDYAVSAVGVIDYVYKSQNPWSNEDIAKTMFRYVVIPGSISGARSATAAPTYEGYTKEQLKAMSYDEVARIFKIPASGGNIQ